MSEEKSMTCTEGRIKGGRKGGASTLERYGEAHFSACGKKGGATTRDRYGKNHYIELGRKGGLAARGAAKVAPVVASDE